MKYKEEFDKNKTLTEQFQALQDAYDRDWQDYEDEQDRDIGEDELQFPLGQPQHHQPGATSEGTYGSGEPQQESQAMQQGE